MCANVRRAAELTALAEQKRAHALRDASVDPLAVMRLHGAADRTVRALQLEEHERIRREAEPLAEFLRVTAEPRAGGPLGNRPQGAIEPLPGLGLWPPAKTAPHGPSRAKKSKVRAGGRP